MLSMAMFTKKSGPFKDFKEFKYLVQTKKGEMIRCSVTINGGEFLSEEFRSFCDVHVM